MTAITARRNSSITGALTSSPAVLVGAFSAGSVTALWLVVPRFEPGLALLGLLYVSRPHRRRGIATQLWERAEGSARATRASRLYVSSVPSGPAVEFYLSRGCRLAAAPHPDLFSAEPDDIHLVKRL